MKTFGEVTGQERRKMKPGRSNCGESTFYVVVMNLWRWPQSYSASTK